MYDSNSTQSLPPEDGNKNHLSVLNRTWLQLQQLKLSYHSSNAASNILLKDVWKKNTELFNYNAQSQITSSAEALLQNADTSQSKNWKSSLSNIDAESIFLKSLPTCSKCSTVEHKGFENFLKTECKCNLDQEPSSSRTNLKRNNSSQDSKSGDEIIFKRFGRQRLAGKNLEPKEEKFVCADSKNSNRPGFSQCKNKQTTLAEYMAINSVPATKNPEQKRSEVITLDDPCPRYDERKNRKQEYQPEVITLDMEKEEEENRAHKSNVAKITFKTAKETLLASNPAAKRSLGASRKAQGKFVSPMIGAQEKQESNEPVVTDERLKNIDPKMIELIESEIIDKGTPISWEDIAGLQLAKSVIQEAVVLPLLRPDIFTGLRRPPKGILLFGPPGTGKTLIGKCVAAQCKATFFSISASSLTSKWIGDGEKMVRALFAVARCHQPAVIFIDEIDSLLTQRSDTEHEATRRIKTEFLVQFDGAAIGEEDRLLIVGATNRPQELDEAARRRLVKRLYIPLPDVDARRQIISNLLRTENNLLTSEEIDTIASRTEGYSGADMKSLCSEAAMGPVRAVPLSQIATIHRDNVRPVCIQDFVDALRRVRPSVSQDDLGQYVKWNQTYGQGF